MGVARLPFTARIERPPVYRGGSPSKKGTWPLTPHPQTFPHLSKGGLVDPLLRASNEHIPIVRVPRAGGRPGYPPFPPVFSHVPGVTTFPDT